MEIGIKSVPINNHDHSIHEKIDKIYKKEVEGKIILVGKEIDSPP